MIGRFKYGDEIFCGAIHEEQVVVDRALYRDTFLLSELKLLPPTQPSKIICVGLNYRDHAKELNMQIPDNPLLFLKPASTVIGHMENIVYPKMSKQVDYEGELAVIIGKRCKNVRAAEAPNVIAGYTCFNDITARDLQKKDTQWTRSKSFDTFAPLGPYLAEPELDISELTIKTWVNGKLRQDSSTANLIFDVAQIIEFVSGIMTLESGDVIATGTPPGVGELFIGDEVEVEIENIGRLKNRVIAQGQQPTPTNIPHVRGNSDAAVLRTENIFSADAALIGQGKYQNRTCESLLPKLSSLLTKEYDWQLSLKLSLRLSSHKLKLVGFRA